MYKITFKGVSEAAYVDEVTGAGLYQDWMNNTMPTKVELEDGHAVLSSSIKSVQRGHRPPGHSDEERQKNVADMAQEDRDYEGARFKLANLPAEEKSKELGIADMMWWIHSGERRIPADKREEFQKRQLAYFKEYPRHAYANPTCYKDFLTLREGTPAPIEKEITPIHIVARQSAMSFIERVLDKDHYHANR